MRDELVARGFAFVPASEMRARLGEVPDWSAFAASWNELVVDPYVAGRYRRRRHARFVAGAGGVTRAPHGPHFQAKQYNPLYGDVERWFEPITDEVGGGKTLTAILAWCHDLFGNLAPETAWNVEVHQFRIEARSGEPGNPTPEGPHRDGVDYVLVLLVHRTNIASGTTTIHAPDGSPLGAFTLAAPFDAALVHDPRVYHGVTPVHAIDPTQPAHRDVLVVTFARDSRASID
jgi:hypothetical protein